MNFLIRNATENDIPEIMGIMNAKPSGKTKPEWYITDEEDAVRKCLCEQGFILVAQTDLDVIAGFFIVKYPEREENLGKYLDFTDEQLEKVVLMDSVAILPEFRGNGLQGILVKWAEEKIDPARFRYLMCTVHPDNVYSLHNMQKLGYEVKKTVTCYGNNIRNVLLKEIK